MTNKQFLILSKAMDIIKSVASVYYVGYYPDNVYSIGQQYPACILRDGDESDVDVLSGNTMTYAYSFDIILHHELNQNLRIEDVLSVQNDIVSAIYGGLESATGCVAITGHSVVKGDVQDAVLGAGYQNEITSRIITFNLSVHDTRS